MNDKEAQIKAPRVTPLEGVSTYAPQGIRVRGVENQQGFDIDDSLYEDKQEQIQQNITKSFNLRKQSRHLLECAKKAVEMAIEKDEETAMRWLYSQLDSIEMGN